MAPDQPPMFFTSGEMDCNEHYSACLMSMTPITSSDEYNGVPTYDNNCYTPWMNTGCDYSLDLPAECYNTAYEPYALPFADGPTSYLTPETLDVGLGSRNGSVSTTNTSTSDSSATEYGYRGADTDANRVPDLVPSSDPKKRGSDSPEKPRKRNCSQTVASTEAPATATRPATRSKENRPPVAAPSSRSSKPKAGDRSDTGKKSSDRAQSSSSNNTAATMTTTTGHKPPQLRTASRRPKAANGKRSGLPPTAAGDHHHHHDKDADDDDLLTPDERRARHSHNLVEKQYRNRLNQQFESLLAVLPPADGVNRVFSAAATNNNNNNSNSRSSRQRGDRSAARGSAAGLEGCGAGDDRRLSKAEVLDMARQRIVTLERECNRLRSENLDFAANVGAVRDAVARTGIAGAAAAA